MKICFVNEMREMDRRAIEEFGIPQEILMENAGEAAYFKILQNTGIKKKNFVFFCGAGNNGGDALVTARKVHSNGGNVKIYILGDPEKFKGAALLNYNIVKELKLPVMQLTDFENLRSELAHSHVIIDGIFGTGLTREVGGIYKQAAEYINNSGKIVVSLDIPSGINGDNGEIMGTAVKADYTITFGLPKAGNLLYPGCEYGGKLSVTHISFPPSLYNSSDLQVSLNLPPQLPDRPPFGHKGTFGKALFISGAVNYLGAPYFSAMAHLKAGGGMSYLAAPDAVTSFIANQGREIVFVPQKTSKSGSIAGSCKDDLLKLSEEMDFVIIGPGLSLNTETQELVRSLVKEIKKPMLIDGDGITAAAQNTDCIKKRMAETVLTPHPGEMARLIKRSVKEISASPLQITQEAAKELGAIIVLKGAHSITAVPDGQTYINLSGNAGMATAGSGDVLTGVISAAACSGLPLSDAARLGVFLHGLAGDICAEHIGQDGLTAGDILNCLPETLKMYRNNYEASVNLEKFGIDII